MQQRAAEVHADPDMDADPKDEARRDTALEERPEVDWDYWLDENPQIVAWLTVPGTDIDCPVVQAPADNPEFYLRHDIFGTWNYAGCPYVDASCPKGVDSPCVLIYGHNLTGESETMFADFAQYVDEDYARKHARIVLQTQDETRELTVWGAAVVEGTSPLNRTAFESEADLTDYRGLLLSRANMVLDGAAWDRDTLYVFCTCSYSTYRNERTLVFATGPPA